MSKYWWFGINNRGKRDGRGKPHVIYPEMEALLHEEGNFAWPYGGKPMSLYRDMKPGDKVILWMGAGPFRKKWGILGIAEINKIDRDGDNSSYMLISRFVPDNPFQPYKSKKPEKTENTDVLKNIFGPDFKPLQKVYLKAGYIDKVSSVAVTVDKVTKKQYSLIWSLLKSKKQKLVRYEKYSEKFAEKVAESQKSNPVERDRRLKKAPKYPKAIEVIKKVYRRNPDVVAKVLERANGFCEICRSYAPFERIADGTPYLEAHHKDFLSSGGEDTVENTLALCPNCHRKEHFGT